MTAWEAISRSAAAEVMRQFGDATIGYRTPAMTPADPAIEWPAVRGTESFAPVYDEATGETSIKVLRWYDVPTELVVADHVTDFQPNATFEADGFVWSLDEATSNWDETFVTFGLVREPLVSKQELRRASV